jgi:hypothetical protein
MLYIRERKIFYKKLEQLSKKTGISKNSLEDSLMDIYLGLKSYEEFFEDKYRNDVDELFEIFEKITQISAEG